MSSRALKTGVALGLAAPVVAFLFPEIASAHALVGRKDLPIPAWLFAWGASLVLIVSFGLLSNLWREARLQQDQWRPVSAGLSRAVLNPVTELLAGLIGVALLVLVVDAGLNGTEDATHNFAIIFTYYTFWLGLVLLSVLIGDVFKAFNPWRAIGRAVSGGFRLVAGQSAPAPLRYPDWLGLWPAVAGIVGFVWLELLSGGGIAPTPHDTAVAAVVYSVITFACMALFGVEEWIGRGEAFSAFFRMFSRLAPFEVREGRLGIRKFLTGVPSWEQVPGSVALVLASIGLTSFDGAQEGLLKSPIQSTVDWLHDIGFGIHASFRIGNSIWMLVVLAGIAGLYWLGVRGMHTVSGSPPTRKLARSFAHTLIPIALAYIVAHYFSSFIYQEQAQFTYILSDPLGHGSDLFGTAASGINYGVLSGKAIWYIQVAALVAGHVTGLTLAHDRALATYGDVRHATRSQYFMLAVMVGFTCFALLLLANANG